MWALTFGIFGAIVGSFLNVVVLRRGLKSLGGRSGCLSCGAQIRARDLVPVISWLLLLGRCRACGSRISTQYPLVELSTAFLFAAVGSLPIGIFAQLLMCTIMALLVLITAYDIRHTIIPDEWSYGFSILALVSIFVMPQPSPVFLALLAGPLAALPFFSLWLFSRGRWMGLGDAKFALGMGWLLGIMHIYGAIMLAFILGALYSVLVLLPLPHYVRFVRAAGIARLSRQTSYTMKSEVPFGPFLICATLVVWFATQFGVPLPFLF